MKLNSEFIRLPLRFDAGRLAEEVSQFAESDWIEHPDRARGNSALPLISSGGGDNNDFKGEMIPTPHLDRCPYIRQVMASFDEVFGRSRLMKLAAGCEVSAHMDYNYHWHRHVRIHVPVITNPAVVFRCGQRQLHMSAGECWIFDAWQVHSVFNGGDQARVHLVVDTAGSSRFWQMVEDASRAERGGHELRERFVAFEKNSHPTLRTERFGQLPVMHPGEIDGLVEELIADFESHEGNDCHATQSCRRWMTAFCRDWRALWYQFGIAPQGWPHFARLLDQATRDYPRLDPPVMIAGGACSAQTVFQAKVLASALAPDLYGQYEARDASALPPLRSVNDSSPAGSRVRAREAQESPDPAPALEIGRNARCHCGSGLRFKHCHGATSSAQAP